MALTRTVQLRLRRDTAPTASEAAAGALELVREARRAVLFTYGPCCAASEPLVKAWARRLAETRPMPLDERQSVLTALADFFAR